MKDHRPKSAGWIASHCEACGHHIHAHGDWGECGDCMDQEPPGPCAYGEDDE